MNVQLVQDLTILVREFASFVHSLALNVQTLSFVQVAHQRATLFLQVAAYYAPSLLKVA